MKARVRATGQSNAREPLWSPLAPTWARKIIPEHNQTQGVAPATNTTLFQVLAQFWAVPGSPALTGFQSNPKTAFE
jgi:hypothetical protein